MREIKSLLILVIVTLLSLNFVYSNNINSLEEIELKIENTIQFDISKENNYQIQFFNVNSFLFPQTYSSQSLISLESNKPNYNIMDREGEGQYLNFYFDNNNILDRNTILNQYIIKSSIHKPQISTKTSYPYQSNFLNNHQRYLQFTKSIDTSTDLRNKASELAQGEDDVFIIATNIAEWIRNDINYNLSTIFLDPDQSSVEVFHSKEGVCREITNLYVSMLRSIGIPARVVSGIAYTDSQEVIDFVGSNWGGHAWAEVLIGDQWVPFDLTYNQYGFVDPTHIVFDKHYELRSIGVSVNGSAYGVQISHLETTPKYEILSTISPNENLLEDNFDIKIDAISELAPGSHGFLEIDVTNNKNYYQVLFLRLSKVDSVELLDPSEMKMLIFEPNQRQTVYYRFLLPDDLERGFIYTFPFTIYNEFLEITTNILVREGAETIREQQLPKEQQKIIETTDNKLNFNCDMNILEKEIVCKIRNTNNFVINNLSICFNQDCSNHRLNLNEEIELRYQTDQRENFVSYDYNREFSQLSIVMPEPELNVDISQEGSLLNIVYEVKDHMPDMSVSLFVNNNFVRSFENQKDFVKVNLPQGESEVKLELRMRSREIASTQARLSVEPTRNPSFIQDILSWIVGIFAL